jgi:hypothetical protein
MRSRRELVFLALTAVAFTLAACNGGSNTPANTPPTPATTPPTPAATTTGQTRRIFIIDDPSISPDPQAHHREHNADTLEFKLKVDTGYSYTIHFNNPSICIPASGSGDLTVSYGKPATCQLQKLSSNSDEWYTITRNGGPHSPKPNPAKKRLVANCNGRWVAFDQ